MKCNLFKIAKRMVKTNQDIIGEHYLRNYSGVLTIGMKKRKELGKVIMSSF